jgi:hypothetical protein
MPPITRPLSAHITMSNYHSVGQVVPIREMTNSLEARYQRVWDGESAFKNESDTTDLDSLQATTSNDSYKQTKGNDKW